MDNKESLSWVSLSAPQILSKENRLSFWQELHDLLDQGHPVLLTDKDLHSKELIHESLKKLPTDQSNCLAFFTSGSTGKPKVIVHRYSSLLQSAKISSTLIFNTLTKKKRILSPLPWFHVGGLLNLFREHHEGFDLITGNSRDLIGEILEGDTYVGVPSQLNDYVKYGNPCNFSFYCGGGACSVELEKKASSLGIKVLSTYGQTESAGAILYREPLTEKTFAFSDVTLSLTNGLLTYKTERLAVGILENSSFHSINNPFVTQDLAEFEGENIVIKGRKDSLIICGGENISLIFLEKELTKIFKEKVYLLAKDDVRLGQIPIAFVELDFAQIKDLYQKHKDHPLLSRSLQRPRYLLALPNHKGIKPGREELLKHFESTHEVIKVGA